MLKIRKLISIAVLLLLAIISVVIFKNHRDKTPELELFNPSLINGEKSVGRFKINVGGKGAGDTLQLHYIIFDTTAVFQGDIIIGTVKKSHGKFMQVQGFFTNQGVWEDAVIPFDFDGLVLNADTGVVYEAMREWTSKTKIRFIRHTDETNFVRFSYGDGYGSFIGEVGNMQPLYFPKDPDKGNLMHEIGHLLGLWHEHCRPDRDRYVKIIDGNIQAGFLCQFIQPVSNVVTLNTTYDLNSIMHYPKNAFAKPGTNTIVILHNSPRIHLGNRDSLSRGDVTGVNLLYKNGSLPTTQSRIRQTPITCSENNP
jgi:hypothetical protein